MILVIDNYDSFTYNLVRYALELGQETQVHYNDQISIEQIRSLGPSAIILSPGPCSPDESGICLDVVEQFAGEIPLLGVCLGHQVICQAFGGSIVRARQVVHGKTSSLFHTNTDLFFGLPQGLQVARYHSLVASIEQLPKELKVLAWTQDDYWCVEEIMAVRHRQLAVYGVQFHPEALLTEHGYKMLGAFFQAQGLDIDESAYNLVEA